MKKILLVVLVLAVAIGALGYWRGWFSVTKEGKVDVQTDPAKFKLDREAFGKAVSEKAKAMKDSVASLWNKSEGLSGDARTHAQKELAELKERQDRLDQQIKELDGAGQAKFESIKEDLSKNREEVEKKIEELTKKLGKGNGE